MQQAPPKGKVVPFKPLSEEWSYYSLEDGTILGVRVVVTKILRLENPDGSPMYDPVGQPAYWFLSQNVMRILNRDEYHTMVGIKGEK